MLGALSLIALRLLIGFHFFSEGTTKLQEKKPFSSTFFEGSKGPLASFYRGHIWDPDGLVRLGYKPADSDDRTSFPTPSIDMDATKANWAAYRDKVANHYNFNEQQNAASKKILDSYNKLLDTFVDEYHDDIITYFRGVERRERNRRDSARSEVESLRGQSADIESDLRRERASLISKIDALWSGLESDLNAIADPEHKKPEVTARRLGRRALDTEAMDKIVPWFDTIIGLCLLAGLFTPAAGVLGAVFLGMVVTSQWPGYPGTVPTWPQAIECIALLHLAFVGAGQYCGLDGILRALFTRQYRRRRVD